MINSHNIDLSISFMYLSISLKSSFLKFTAFFLYPSTGGDSSSGLFFEEARFVVCTLVVMGTA